MKDRHHAGFLHLEILADAVLEHRVVARRIRLRDAAQIYEHPDRLRSEGERREDTGEIGHNALQRHSDAVQPDRAAKGNTVRGAAAAQRPYGHRRHVPRGDGRHSCTTGR